MPGTRRIMERGMLAAACCAIVALSCSYGREKRANPAKKGTEMKASEPAGARKDFEITDESFRQILRPDSAVRLLAGGLKFTEGPVWMAKDKCLLFSDIPANTIYRWREGKGLKVFRKPSHNSNGHTVDRQGRLVSCEHGSRTVTRTEKDGKITTLAATYKGKKLNSPNDVVVRSDGTIWFTDPPYGIRPNMSEQKANYVFRLDPGATKPVVVAEDFTRPNGLCFSPDEKYLYIADSGGPRHIRRFSVRKDNTLEKGKVFVRISPGGPDGIRVDSAGRLYSTAGDGVQVFSPEGKLLGKIKTPKAAANCAFGGPGHRTLFITARDSLWAVNLAAAGAK